MAVWMPSPVSGSMCPAASPMMSRWSSYVHGTPCVSRKGSKQVTCHEMRRSAMRWRADPVLHIARAHTVCMCGLALAAHCG